MAFIDLIKYFTGKRLSPNMQRQRETERRSAPLMSAWYTVLRRRWRQRVLSGKDPSVRHTRLFITVTHRIRFAVLMPRELRGLLWADAVWTKCVTALFFVFFVFLSVTCSSKTCKMCLRITQLMSASYFDQLCCRGNGNACNWLRLVIDSCSMTRQQQWFRK